MCRKEPCTRQEKILEVLALLHERVYRLVHLEVVRKPRQVVGKLTKLKLVGASVVGEITQLNAC